MSRAFQLGPIKTAWMGGVAGYLLARNLAFKHAPRAANALMRLSNVSGRGRGRDGQDAAFYFEGVAKDYEVIARTAAVAGETASIFQGKRVLELGPGNTQSVALIARARGALHVSGWDAFDVLSRDEAYLKNIYDPLLKRMGESRSAGELLDSCKVHVSREAVAKEGPYDLVISRAVLEHVRELETLYEDLAALTTNDAVVIHKIDLRSHGFELSHELDFLLFPERAWRRLTTHIGEPNRARFPRYLEIGKQHGFVPLYAATTRTISAEKVERIRNKLASPYRDMPPDVLGVLGFWLVQVRKEHPLAKYATYEGKLDPAPAELLANF